MSMNAGAVTRPAHIRPRRWCVEHPHCLAAQDGVEFPIDGDALASRRVFDRLLGRWFA